jgi:arylsulfatase A-like enzyme
VAALAMPNTFGIEPLIASQSRSARRPNVLFVVSDDLNDWIGALGGHPIPSPTSSACGAGVLFRAPHAQRQSSPGSTGDGSAAFDIGVYHNRQPFGCRQRMQTPPALRQRYRAVGQVTHGVSGPGDEYARESSRSPTESGRM